MKIIFPSKTIEVTKTFANKASRFGSAEYQMLQTAMCDFPDFTVATMSSLKTMKPMQPIVKKFSWTQK